MRIYADTSFLVSLCGSGYPDCRFAARCGCAGIECQLYLQLRPAAKEAGSASSPEAQLILRGYCVRRKCRTLPRRRKSSDIAQRRRSGPVAQARFDEMQRYWENQRKDPDDVFFAANDRDHEIRDRIEELQSGLDRQKPRRKKKRSR